MIVVYDSAKRRILLGREVGHGGEAAIYRVQGQETLLAKVYMPPIHPHYAPKVAWMRDHPPEEPDYSVDIDEHKALAWPIELLYDRKGRFTGYLMPRIRGGVTLLKVFNPRLRAQSLPFDHKYLHRTARNLAAAVASLHAKGYVVGDLHESNAIVTPQALVTMIDTDSFQVRAKVRGEEVCYRCVVGKPEYTAPELQGKHLADVTRGPEQDNFALAVLIFQLLMWGNHPFRSLWKRAGEPPPLEVKIARGLFPHVKPPPDPVELPPNVPSLGTLHPGLSALMQRCFVDGHNDPHLRPTAAEWRGGLEEAEAALMQCAKGHYHSNLLVKCPQCEADKRTAKRAKHIAAARRRRAAAARQQRRITFSSWLQHGQRQTARPAQPRVARTRVRPTTRAPVLKQALRPRLVVMGFLLLAVICLIYSFANISPPERSRPAMGVPTATLRPTPTLSPPLSGASLSQSMVAISPENCEQVTQLDNWAYTSDVLNVVFSPDGTLLALRGRDGEVRIQEVASGRGVRTFSGSTIDGDIAFSSDGVFLAFKGSNDTVEVWEVSTQRRVYSLKGIGKVTSLAFSPNGTLLAVGGEYRSNAGVDLWDVATGDKVYTLSGDSDSVNSVAFSPDGSLLAGSGGGVVELWRVTSGDYFNRRVRIFFHEDVKGMAFSPDGALLMTWARDGKVRMWRVLGEGEEFTLVHDFPVYAVAFSPTGALLVTASQDRVLSLWEVSTKSRIHAFSGDSKVYSLAFSPDGTLLASGHSGGTVTLWGIPPGAMSPLPDTTLGAISGVVTYFGTGLPVIGASVTTDPPTASITTDAEGEFSIPNVPPGSYTVTVTKSGYAIDSMRVSVQADGMVDDVILLVFPQPLVTLTSPPMFPGATSDATSGVISGVVFDMKTELPMLGVNVTTDLPTSSVMTDAEGRFTIPAVPPGSYLVEAAKHGLTIGKEAAVVACKQTVVDFGMLDVSGLSVTSMPAPGVP